MKILLKSFFIFGMTFLLVSCSDNINKENKLTEKTEEITSENSNENSVVSGTFGSDGAFTNNNIDIEVSENPEAVNELIYEEIYNDFIFHSIDIAKNKIIFDKNKLLEQFIQNNVKIGKFYLQKNIANYLYSYYSNSSEGKAEKEYILFDKSIFTSKESLSLFEKENPGYSKNNNLNNEYLENVFLFELNKNTTDDLPSYSSEVDQLIKNLYTRKINETIFDNELSNTVNLFFIFEFVNKDKEKTVCTLILPNKISLYAMDIDYSSSYKDYYKNSPDTKVKANLPDLSSIVGKIQAFTSFYTSCISL
jgi:hypothetical protein